MQSADWIGDEAIVFGTNLPSGLWRVSASGGEPEALTTPDETVETENHLWPHVLPDGRGVLFTIQIGTDGATGRIAHLDLDTGVVRDLLPTGTRPRYVPSGHLLYAAAGTVQAVGFDLGTLEVDADRQATVLEGLVTKPNGAANFDIADDGSLVYLSGGGLNRRQLVWVDRLGRATDAATLEADLFRTVSSGGQAATGLPPTCSGVSPTALDRRTGSPAASTTSFLTRSPAMETGWCSRRIVQTLAPTLVC